MLKFKRSVSHILIKDRFTVCLQAKRIEESPSAVVHLNYCSRKADNKEIFYKQFNMLERNSVASLKSDFGLEEAPEE